MKYWHLIRYLFSFTMEWIFLGKVLRTVPVMGFMGLLYTVISSDVVNNNIWAFYVPCYELLN